MHQSKLLSGWPYYAQQVIHYLVHNKVTVWTELQANLRNLFLYVIIKSHYKHVSNIDIKVLFVQECFVVDKIAMSNIHILLTNNIITNYSMIL